MTFLAQLWLPIVVSAVLVFVLSAMTHMLVPYRQREWSRPAGQDALQAALKGAAPGLYAFPVPAEPRERMKPEAMARWAAGPSGWLSLVPPGPIRMGRNLGLSLLVNLLVSFMAAYVAFHALGHAAHYRAVFRLVGTVGVLAYAVGPIYEAIWYWKPWRTLAMTAVDALVFGLAMAGVFGWLWPR
jgi:hypothetical protein